jgi:hypothetical protein
LQQAVLKREPPALFPETECPLEPPEIRVGEQAALPHLGIGGLENRIEQEVRVVEQAALPHLGVGGLENRIEQEVRIVLVLYRTRDKTSLRHEFGYRSCYNTLQTPLKNKIALLKTTRFISKKVI